MGEKYKQNIFELLDDEGAKKQKPKKEAAAPKADNKGKAKAPAKAAPAGDAKKGGQQAKGTPAKGNNQQGQQQGQGRGTQGGRGQNRGRGGERGRGGRGGRGRGEGRGRGGDGSFPVDENRQGNNNNNNNRGKQVSRRQRDEAFKRGDYGAPDAEGRQKRPYDKFSHSSGARRKTEKKGGHGAGNWGEKGKVAEDAPAPAEDEQKKEEGEEVQVQEEVEDEKEEEAEAQEESDDDIDYEAYIEKKKKEDEELSKLVEVEVRQVDDAEFEGMKPLAKGNTDEQLFPQKGGKKNKKKAVAKNEPGVSVDKVLDVQAPRQQDNRRGNNKGRQSGRPQRSNNKRNVNLTLDDDNDFPSLGGK